MTIGQNLQPFTGIVDVFIWVNIFQVERKSPNKKVLWEVNTLQKCDSERICLSFFFGYAVFLQLCFSEESFLAHNIVYKLARQSVRTIISRTEPWQWPQVNCNKLNSLRESPKDIILCGRQIAYTYCFC